MNLHSGTYLVACRPFRVLANLRKGLRGCRRRKGSIPARVSGINPSRLHAFSETSPQEMGDVGAFSVHGIRVTARP